MTGHQPTNHYPELSRRSSRPRAVRPLFVAGLLLMVLGVCQHPAVVDANQLPVSAGMAPGNETPLSHVIEEAWPKLVKIYGAGGYQGLENYQSGVLISADGHVLTALTHVLDTDYLVAVLDDGRRFDATLVGADPRREIALLKIPADNLEHYKLTDAPQAPAGTLVLALSNAFGVATGDEPASVQHGTIATRAPLDARRGRFDTPYTGTVYVLDVTTNNPSAAGGALIDHSGRLLGLLGKELRNASNNTWLNYALPIDDLRLSARAILAGEDLNAEEAAEEAVPDHPLNPSALGLIMLPEVLQRTPPYIEAVRDDSPAATAGLRADDLVVTLNDRLVQSLAELSERLAKFEVDQPVRMTVLRGGDVPELIEVTLQADLSAIH